MRNIAISFILSVLMACSPEALDTKSETKQDPALAEGPPREESHENDDVEGAPQRGPCEIFSEHEIRLDGGTIHARIPIPCDPFWELKDRGDPPPWNSK